MEKSSSFVILSVSLILVSFTNNVYVISSVILKDSLKKSERNFVDTDDKQYAAKEFSDYLIVQPLIYHRREKTEIPQKNSLNQNNLTIVLPASKEKLILDLILNKQLLPKGYFVQIQENGTHKTERFDSKEIDLCHYTGKVRNKLNSWVALSACDGLSGVVYDGDHMHYIEKIAKRKTNDHFLYSDINLVEQNTCGHDKEKKINFRNKRNSVQNSKSVNGPWNANSESRYLELILVVDNGIYKEMDENLKNVADYCKNVANIMNRLYFPLNIFIALIGVVVWTEKDEINFALNGDTTLTNFLHYRRTKLLKEQLNDHAHLLTKSIFEGGLVGKTLKTPICTTQFSGGVTRRHSSSVGLVATTVAHELGHNFGMEHDTEQCECPEKQCIMSPLSSGAPTQWSSCSRSAVQYAFEHGMDHCLKNKPVSLFQSSTCGNGFVEDGEECDCGLPENCTNNCCDPVTCKLLEYAACATGECCNLRTCDFKHPGTICRKVTNECDLPEYCTGDGEFCPRDAYKMDTEVCGSNNSYCYKGHCSSHLDQCKLLWGTSAQQADDACYKTNIKGNRHGNCGYDKLNTSYEKCDVEDVFCGMLHCDFDEQNSSLQYGLESVSILGKTFINSNGNILTCRSAIIDLGLSDPDPGMVPNGAKCGNEKMCLNQKCVTIESLQEVRLCPRNCYNNGWCNNLGHCHCKPGYTLPFCRNLSPGGSVDSGPPSITSLDVALLL